MPRHAKGSCCLFALATFALLNPEPAFAGEKISEKTTAVTKLTFHAAGEKPCAWGDLTGKAATVVVFLSFDCPMSNSYAQPLSELAKQYDGRGVKFVGVCPCDDSAAQVSAKAKEFQLSFPIFKDEHLAATEALNARLTPSVFVLDVKSELRYSGMIDDAYVKRLVPNKAVSKHYLQDALDALLAGKPVPVAKTDAIGCSIGRDTKRGNSTEVTYYRDVLPILQERCQSCHRPGEVGPFSLMNYKQAANWADDIKEYTQSRKMPPWKPHSGPEYSGARRLTDLEIGTLAKWVDNSCPAGDAKEAPAPKRFPDGWYLGKPDLILTLDEDFVLGPTGKDLFRVYVMPTGLTEDKYVRAVEVRPGSPRVVHHALNYYDTTGTARKLQEDRQAEERKNRKPEDVDVGPGYSATMGLGFQRNLAALQAGKFGAMSGWAPGILPRELPPGVGFYLPKGSDFIIQIHYHRNGRLEKDRVQVGLYFQQGPVETPMAGLVIPGRFKPDPDAKDQRRKVMGYIPAGDEHFVAHGTITTDEDCVLRTVMPHMHLLGKSVKITMTPPDGKTELLIDIPEWDYNWQENYFLKEPIAVKAGTRFDIEAVYDNSAKNPNNPSNPPINVLFGEQTTNEMLFGFIGATKSSKSGSPYFIRPRLSSLIQQFRPPAKPDR
jgi:hypothetical protein